MCGASYGEELPGILAHERRHLRIGDLPGTPAIAVDPSVVPSVGMEDPQLAHLAACERVRDVTSAGFLGDAERYCRTLARVAL